MITSSCGTVGHLTRIGIRCVTHLLPTRVVVQLLDHPIPQRLGQKLHERCAWCDGIRIPRLLVLLVFAYSLPHGCADISIAATQGETVGLTHIPILQRTLCVLPLSHEPPARYGNDVSAAGSSLHEEQHRLVGEGGDD